MYIDIGHNFESPGAVQDDVTESSNFTVFVFTPFLTSGDRETMSSNNHVLFMRGKSNIAEVALELHAEEA